MSTFVQEGKVIDVDAPSAVDAGDIIVLGADGLVGVACEAAESGDRVAMRVGCVEKVPKTGGTEALSVGDYVYVSGTGGVVSTDDSGSPLGFVVEDASQAAESVKVKFAAGWSVSSLIKWAKASYTVADNGGTVASHAFGAALVAGTEILYATLHVTVQPDSSEEDATVALGVASDDATGLLTATAEASLTTGYHDLLPDWAAANFTTKTSNGSRTLIATVAGHALTSGSFTVWYAYRVNA